MQTMAMIDVMRVAGRRSHETNGHDGNDCLMVMVLAMMVLLVETCGP
jgi:hypothetical protein